MFKKFISYLIIFSILSADVAHCGGVSGKSTPENSDDEQKSHYIAVRRQTTEYPEKASDRTEQTPLVIGRKKLDDSDIPDLPKNFSFESFTETSQAQSLSLWPHSRGDVAGSLEEDTDEMVGEGERASLAIPESPINANFKAMNDKRKGDNNLSQWTRTSTDNSAAHSNDEDASVGDSLVLLEDDSAGETETGLKSKEPSDYNIIWQRDPAPSPHSPYENETDSVRGLQLFFEDFLSTNRVDIQTPLPPQSLVINQEDSDQESSTSAQELMDFVLVGNLVSGELIDMESDEFPNLSPESHTFLRYVKKRVVDGELNWKQKLGIAGGVIMGASVSWPWMCIMFDSLLKFYAYHVGQSLQGKGDIPPELIKEKFQRFNELINLKSMIPLVGIPIGSATASNLASVLMDWAKEDRSFFSVQRSHKHKWALWGVQGAVFLGTLFSGILPIYYLHSSSIYAPWDEKIFEKSSNLYFYYCLSSDVHLNILTATPSNNLTCSDLFPQPWSSTLLFYGGGALAFLSTVFWQGHRLSRLGTRWVDAYFLNKQAKSSDFLNTETLRQDYLNQLHTLMRHIPGIDEESVNRFYDDIFHTKNLDLTNSDLSETLHILKSLKNFQTPYESPIEDCTEQWKKTWASNIGWGLLFTATMGRMMIFQFVIRLLLDVFPGNRYNSTYDIVSHFLGYALAHWSQGFIQQEAIEKGIYEILGGKKFSQNNSHPTLRTTLKVWNYFYGLFQTFPYLAIGLQASTFIGLQESTFERGGLFPGNPFEIKNLPLILFIGISDVFVNSIYLNYANLNIINVFDSIKSYVAPSASYKKDKLTQKMRHFYIIFESLHPEILKQINTSLTKEPTVLQIHTQDISPPENNSFFHSSDRLPGSIVTQFFNKITKREEDFILASKLSLQVQDFLRHLKIHIIDGQLNRKQKAGIVGGIITGAAVAWPMMLILFDGLLSPCASIIYFNSQNDLRTYFENKVNYKRVNDTIYDTIENFKILSLYFNFKTMLALIGIPIFIDAASRTTAILMDFTQNSVQLFSLQKSKHHERALFFAKSSTYFGVLFAGILPVYYLFDSIIGCNKNESSFYYYFYDNDSKIPVFNFSVDTDIYLNLNSTFIRLPTNTNISEVCKHIKPDLPTDNIRVFFIGGAFLFLDTVLQYGHQLSHHIERWLNDYFFAQMYKSSQSSFAEMLRDKYLTHFKKVKKSIFLLEDQAIDNLYDTIFMENTLGENQSSEEVTLTNALRILKVFNTFSIQKELPSETEDSDSSNWKKVWASRIGWYIPLVVTAGRILVFQYILGELFELADFTGAGADILALLFSGVFANVSQGFIEKDAVEKVVYEILGGKKTSDAQSHSSLRKSIKVWNYLYGALHTFPYLTIGMDAYSGKKTLLIDPLAPWQYFMLVSFCLADAFNNAIGFHESNLNVVNTYDSLVATYGTPSPEVKRDILVKKVHKIRQLFKELDHSVLEQVDLLLNQDTDDHGRRASDALFAEEDLL